MQDQEGMQDRRVFRAFRVFGAILDQKVIRDAKDPKVTLDHRDQPDRLDRSGLWDPKAILGHRDQEGFRDQQDQQEPLVQWDRRV